MTLAGQKKRVSSRMQKFQGFTFANNWQNKPMWKLWWNETDQGVNEKCLYSGLILHSLTI